MKYAKYISSRHLFAASPCATLALSATSVCAMGYSAAAAAVAETAESAAMLSSVLSVAMMSLLL